MRLRFHPAAAETMREAIRDAEGREVFAIGDVDKGNVTELVIAARGQEDRVLAVLGRPRSGQVVIHNHPSGGLRPSDADLQLAARYAEDGVGFVIVDNDVSNSAWIVEPWDAAQVAIDPEQVDQVFTEALMRAMPGSEIRDAQRQMAARVTASLNEGRPLLIEAGTGTGKSLAYLVPAAMWALANDTKVVIATHTKALQSQLLGSDLPLLARVGIDVRTAVLEGRNNYLCKRRLGLAQEEVLGQDDETGRLLGLLAEWSASTERGTRTELAEAIPPDLWERVESDTDLTLRLRCEHYDSCHFYQARRHAGAAHLVIVNHALLVSDLAIRHESGAGILPSYRRVILDEAHHLEDVATGMTSAGVTALAIRRAVSSIVQRGKRPGGLSRLAAYLAEDKALPADIRARTLAAVERAESELSGLPTMADVSLTEVAGVLDPSSPTRRLDERLTTSVEWTQVVAPHLESLSGALHRAESALSRIAESLEDQRLPEAKSQPLLEVGRARRRLATQAGTLKRFLDPPAAASEDGPTDVRWLELAMRRSSTPSAAVRVAPVDVADTLRALLWHPLPGTVCTSATLSVGGDFAFWKERHGLDDPAEDVLPSPFDHFRQAILGLPTDLPSPDEPHYMATTARALTEAIALSGGGAFVLCTSYRAVDAYAEVLRASLGPHQPLLVQGTMGRAAMLQRFKERQDSVLVGTDSFWEGVSVKGHGLRLVILPRLPFRVPNDPLSEARYERLRARGEDPFRADALPRAILKLRQGYGRLLRSREDRGVVLLLDTRVHSRAYGRRILAALPPARRVKGPWARVKEELARHLGPGGSSGEPPVG